jgi:THO complex subunit 2
MHIQNYFPVTIKPEQVILKRVEKIRDEEKGNRQDLYVLASSYLGILMQKHGRVMKEKDFHLVTEATNNESDNDGNNSKQSH